MAHHATERKLYRKMPASAFTKRMNLNGEEIGVHEKRLANLKKGRGRVRRIVLRMPDKSQVNLLAASRELTERLMKNISADMIDFENATVGISVDGNLTVEINCTQGCEAGNIVKDSKLNLTLNIRVIRRRSSRCRPPCQDLDYLKEGQCKVYAR